MKQIRSRLTYANVVSSLCLFLLLAGATAFAASQLGKNSVGTKQLKSNAVTTAKIKKEAVTANKIKKATITGKQINLAKLGTVPTAQLANTIPAAEATHLVGAPGEPSFENGSSNLGSSGAIRLNSVGFYKDHEGIVHLEGIAKAGKSSSGVASIFTLPAGFRPAAGTVLLFEQISEATAIIGGSNTVAEGIDLSGKVVGSEEKPVVLDGITFRAAS